MRYDPYSYDIQEDPYPTYRWLRDHAPAYHDAARDFYALSRYADVRAAVTDHEHYSSAHGITLEPQRPGMEPMLLEMDPPRHPQLRALVSRAFTPKRVTSLEGPIRQLARELIARFADRGECDVIGELSALLPMAVISEMLSVPPDRQDELRHASD